MSFRLFDQRLSESENEVAGTSGTSFCVVNSHSLENIVRLSEMIEVKASTNIVDECGVTLWPGGMRMSRAVQHDLLGRRLRHPLETSLDVADGLSMAEVISDGLALIASNPILEALAGRSEVSDSIRSLHAVDVSGPLRLLLTAVRELRPADYRASLATMIVSAGLAHHAGLSERDAGHLILAALVADIGEMFVDPELLVGKRKLSPAEWKRIVWHPCLGEEFLKEFTSLPAAVTDGVLRHHERFDGRGYPFQVGGEHLGFRHTMLGCADTIAAIVMRGGANKAQDRINHVLVALHLLPGEFAVPILSLSTKMLAGFDGTSSGRDNGTDLDDMAPDLERLRAAKREAARLAHGHGRVIANAADMALNLLLRIDHSLGATRVYEFLQCEESASTPAISNMIQAIPGEMSWRLRNLARNVHLQAAQSGNSRDLAELDGLLALLDPVPATDNRELAPE